MNRQQIIEYIDNEFKRRDNTRIVRGAPAKKDVREGSSVISVIKGVKWKYTKVANELHRRPLDIEEVSPEPQETRFVNRTMRSSVDYLELIFDYTDTDATINIGAIPAYAKVFMVTFNIRTAFDNPSVHYSIGDDNDNARLMNYTDFQVNYANVYQFFPEVKYTAETMVKLYRTGSATPSHGEVTATVWYL